MPSHYNSTSTATTTSSRLSTDGGLVSLNISTGKGSYLKSISPDFKTIINRVYTLTQEGDGFRTLLTLDGIGSNTNLYQSTSLVLCNEGTQTIELRLGLANFNETDDKIDTSTSARFVHTLLNGGEFIYLPHNLFFVYDTSSTKSATFKSNTNGDGVKQAFVDPDSATRSDGQNRLGVGRITPTTDYTSSTDPTIKLNGAISSSTATTITTDNHNLSYFFTNDIIQIGSEKMRIVSVPSTTTLEVERGVLGTTSASSHSDDSVINLDYLNESNDTVIKTNSNGVYQSSTFFGYGRHNTGDPRGLQRGSISIKVREPAYQEFGLTGQTVNTSTGLATSTSFDFKITNDGDSQQTITIVTDSSNVNWGGTNGILNKINDQFRALYKANTFTFLPKIAIVNGDIRVTSGSRLSTSSIVLADGTSNNLIGGSAGRIPNVDNYITQATKMPRNYETGKIIFDDGKGNLSGGQGSGTIDYTSGAVVLNTFADAQFEISCAFNQALSGSTLINSNQPRISTIQAQSINSFRDANLRVICYDPEFGDESVFTTSGSSGSSSGKR